MLASLQTNSEQRTVKIRVGESTPAMAAAYELRVPRKNRRDGGIGALASATSPIT
jgi:hypothetical protein